MLHLAISDLDLLTSEIVVMVASMSGLFKLKLSMMSLKDEGQLLPETVVAQIAGIINQQADINFSLETKEIIGLLTLTL